MNKCQILLEFGGFSKVGCRKITLQQGDPRWVKLQPGELRWVKLQLGTLRDSVSGPMCERPGPVCGSGLGEGRRIVLNAFGGRSRSARL